MNKYFNNYGCWHKPVNYASLENKLYSKNSLAPAPWLASLLPLTSNTDKAAVGSLLCTIPPHIGSRFSAATSPALQRQNRDVKTG